MGSTTGHAGQLLTVGFDRLWLSPTPRTRTYLATAGIYLHVVPSGAFLGGPCSYCPDIMSSARFKRGPVPTFNRAFSSADTDSYSSIANVGSIGGGSFKTAVTVQRFAAK